MLSENQFKIADLYNISIGNVKKLVPSLFDKEKYVVHYENVKFYLRIGLKLKKNHRVLEFNQPQWLKPYNEFNTQKRKNAEKNSHKDGKALYQLMSNLIYIKTMEHLSKRISAQLVNNEEKDYLKYASKPSCMSHKTFDNNLVAIRKSKPALKLNKPVYLETCILELSKVLM